MINYIFAILIIGDNMKKHASILIIFGLAVLLVTVIGATFAYFANGSINTTNEINVNAATGNVTNIDLVTIGDTLSMNISSQSMIKANISSDPVTSDNGTLKIKLNAGSNELPIECEYDIYYVYESSSGNYTRTDNNKNEFTYKIEKDSSVIIDETNFINKSTTPQKVYTGKIKSTGSEVIHTYDITTKFYNINADQSSNSNKTFIIKFYVDTNEGRCTNASNGYTGVAYRNNSNYVDGNARILVNGPQWVMSNGEEDFFYYDTETQCNQRLTEMNNAFDWPGEGFTCTQKTGTYGIGDYEISQSDQLNKTYILYCIGEECTSSSTNYSTIEECERDYGEGNCISNSVTKPFYLKHQVVGDVISSTETCLYLNNHEFCMGPNYWVEGDIDGSQTKTKLRNDMESKLGLTLAGCFTFSGNVDCSFDAADCIVTPDGRVNCSVRNIGGCMVDANGDSKC